MHMSDQAESLLHVIRSRLAATPRSVWFPLAIFLITRLAIFTVAYISLPIVADNPISPPYHLRGMDNLLVDVLGSRWDTGFYVSIVEEGYRYEGVTFPSVPFFPLLPMAMRALLPVTGDAVTAGILAANLALLGAAIIFFRLVEIRHGQGTADRAVWYLLIFPVSFFGSAIYSESLFLLTAIGALYLARIGRWQAAAAAGFLAGLSRFMGLVVAPLILVEWLLARFRAGKDEPAPWMGILAAAAVPLGTLSYMGYLLIKFGNPLAFIQGSAAWGRVPQSPLDMIAALVSTPETGWWRALAGGQIHLDNWLDFLFVAGFLGLGIVILVRREWAEGVFVLAGSLVALNSGLLMSQRRYMWVLFPVYIVLARWGERVWVDRLVTAVSLALLGLFTVLFANGYWVG